MIWTIPPKARLWFPASSPSRRRAATPSSPWSRRIPNPPRCCRTGTEWRREWWQNFCFQPVLVTCHQARRAWDFSWKNRKARFSEEWCYCCEAFFIDKRQGHYVLKHFYWQAAIRVIFDSPQSLRWKGKRSSEKAELGFNRLTMPVFQPDFVFRRPLLYPWALLQCFDFDVRSNINRLFRRVPWTPRN